MSRDRTDVHDGPARLARRPSDADLDRLRELANIGAGHAAGAFALLTGRTIWTRVPEVRLIQARPHIEGKSEWSTGVLFEFEGYLDALVGILFREAASEAIVRHVVGIEDGELPPHSIEAALMEVGNILASHVASAIADTVGVRLLPSIPTLAMERADDVLHEHLATRAGSHPLRIDCELYCERDELGGLLVLIPTLPGV